MADATDAGRRWPLASTTARLLFLRAVCAVAEGADVPTVPDTSLSSSRCPPAVCVAAVLSDPLRRVSLLGGREGMRRSLGSVYGGSITRFLGGSCRGVVSRVIPTDVMSWANGIACSVDGTRLVQSHSYGRAQRVHEFSVSDCSLLRFVGDEGDSPRFARPLQVCVAPDGFVFVADNGNNLVQVLTPSLDFHSYVGEGQLSRPVGVCANADVVVVTEQGTHTVAVFNRRTGALLRRFGREGDIDGALHLPAAVCFMSGDRHVAVADSGNNRVSVFSADGEFIHHIGVSVLSHPQGVAASAFDELVVADPRNKRLHVFSGTGDLLTSMGEGSFTGVVLHSTGVFAADVDTLTVVVFQ
jgi:DNA-binding beta-propeller fold protein YncE